MFTELNRRGSTKFGVSACRFELLAASEMDEQGFDSDVLPEFDSAVLSEPGGLDSEFEPVKPCDEISSDPESVLVLWFVEFESLF